MPLRSAGAIRAAAATSLALGPFGAALAAAGQAALHAGEKLRGAEGLLQEIHGPFLHGADARGHVTVARHEDDGDVASGLREG